MISDDAAVRQVHAELLRAWNNRDAKAMASVFAEDGRVIGFDGSEMRGPREIAETLSGVFADHETAAYVWKVRDVRFPSADVALLHAVVGMVPPGETDVNPDANAHQTLVAARRDDAWVAVLFQNTPAQFHGRPEARRALSEELQELVG